MKIQTTSNKNKMLNLKENDLHPIKVEQLKQKIFKKIMKKKIKKSRKIKNRKKKFAFLFNLQNFLSEHIKNITIHNYIIIYSDAYSGQN